MPIRCSSACTRASSRRTSTSIRPSRRCNARAHRQHPYYTHQILSTVPGLEEVCSWASLHHERLDGTGYPFRRSAIPLEARIVTVADVFTAITEDRPYRKGMSRAEGMQVLFDLVRDGAIDGDIVSLLQDA